MYSAYLVCCFSSPLYAVFQALILILIIFYRSEHGSPPDRAIALDNVILNATEYSMDQFASKIVEKCLKVAGPEFVDRYLDRVCEGRPDRPRIPLIDSEFGP